jgi:hypothetical protein
MALELINATINASTKNAPGLAVKIAIGSYKSAVTV